MSFLPLLVLWLQSGFTQVSPTILVAESQNTVRVCTQIEGTCKDMPAVALEPRGAASGGVLAFVDPETGRLVAPTAEQVEELSVRMMVDESVDRTEPLRVQKMPDGTLKLGPTTSFVVHQQVVLEDGKRQEP